MGHYKNSGNKTVNARRKRFVPINNIRLNRKLNGNVNLRDVPSSDKTFLLPTTEEQYKVYLTQLEHDAFFRAIEDNVIDPLSANADCILKSKWMELTEKLNSENGPKLEWEVWQKRFADWKFETRRKYLDMIKDLSIFEAKMLYLTGSPEGTNLLRAYSETLIPSEDKVNSEDCTEIEEDDCGQLPDPNQPENDDLETKNISDDTIDIKLEDMSEYTTKNMIDDVVIKTEDVSESTENENDNSLHIKAEQLSEIAESIYQVDIKTEELSEITGSTENESKDVCIKTESLFEDVATSENDTTLDDKIMGNNEYNEKRDLTVLLTNRKVSALKTVHYNKDRTNLRVYHNKSYKPPKYRIRIRTAKSYEPPLNEPNTESYVSPLNESNTNSYEPSLNEPNTKSDEPHLNESNSKSSKPHNEPNNFVHIITPELRLLKCGKIGRQKKKPILTGNLALKSLHSNKDKKNVRVYQNKSYTPHLNEPNTIANINTSSTINKSNPIDLGKEIDSTFKIIWPQLYKSKRKQI